MCSMGATPLLGGNILFDNVLEGGGGCFLGGWGSDALLPRFPRNSEAGNVLADPPQTRNTN